MDYKQRDNFNNWLLTAFSIFGLITIFSGLLCFGSAAQRSEEREKRWSYGNGKGLIPRLALKYLIINSFLDSWLLCIKRWSGDLELKMKILKLRKLFL